MNVPDILIHPTANSQLDAFLEAPMHAVLLTGPAGIGKTHIAKHVAAHLLEVSDLTNHAYFRIIIGEKDSIGIEQIRNLIGFFRLKVPGDAHIRRAAIIQDADTMGIEAQNALLKILEEPPTDSVLILTSSRLQGLLPTIQSRVESLQLAAPNSTVLTKHFIDLGYEQSVVTSALLRSGTSVAEAKRLLEDADEGNNTIDLVKQALGGTTYDRLLLVDGMAKQKTTAVAFTSTLSTVASASLESAAHKGTASVHRWRSILEAAHIAEDALARSGNVKLVLTELMLTI